MLLTMMDGAEGLSGVYVLAATSRPDLIDPALLRPGRLDKSLLCDMPNESDRLDILRAVCASLKIDPAVLHGQRDKSLADVAARTEGYSGADLQAIVYNAHLDAIHDVLGPGQGGGGAQLVSEPNGTTEVAQEEERRPDFTSFIFGDVKGQQRDDLSAVAATAAERAHIIAKLSAVQSSRRKVRAERHGHNHARPAMHDDARSSTEPIISWKNLQRSLEETRPSISAQERSRLAKVYREFLVGRSGKMNDGEASNEIGGRTSLM